MGTNQQDIVLNAFDTTSNVNLNSNTSVEGLTSNNSNGNIKGQQDDASMIVSNSNRIYRDDVVKLIDGNKIGIVIEVAGELDSESEITDDDEDDDDHDDEGSENEGKDDDREEEGGDNEKEDNDDEENKEGENIRKSDATESADESTTSDSLLADQVRIFWLDGSESSHHNNELTVVDRGFLHGEYVASVSNPTEQVGLVVDANIYVDLLTPNGSVIKDVSTRDLKRVRELTIGDFVVFGPWLGRVNDVLDNVTVLFDDGSVCKVIRVDPLRLTPTNKSSIEDSHCPYHPGQRVKASSSSIFKNSVWLTGSWKPNKREGIVTKVAAGSVYVHWIASTGYGPKSSTTPAEEQSPKNLKMLSCFTHAYWQLGEWCLLPSSTQSTGSTSDHIDLDKVGSKHGSGSGTSLSGSRFTHADAWPIHRKKLRKVVIKRDKKVRKKEETYEKALQIVNTKTRVSVVWQDGVIKHQLETTSLVSVESPGDQDFIPEQYVVERGNDDDIDDKSDVRRVGVVKSVNAKEKTASVKWLKPFAKPEDPREFDKEEIVSVYELQGHPDYDYCYGDVVVRLSPVSVSDETNDSESVDKEMVQKSSSNVATDDMKNELPLNEVDNFGLEEASIAFSDLSWVGNITGLKDGEIEVTWADGIISTVGPQAIYVVGRDDDDATVVADSEISDAVSWETIDEDEDEIDVHGNEEKVHVSTSDTDNTGMGETIVDDESNPEKNGALAIPLAAIGFVTKLASEIFSGGRKDEEDSLSTTSVTEDKEMPSNPVESSSQDSTSNEKPNDPPIDNDSTDNHNFKHFDTAKDPLDHFFLGIDASRSGSRKWLKKVQQDWNILQNNLPDSIYVRVYEERMDLLRAVIVGAYGTPYQDGMFFFDFHLPSEYPDVPPSVHYHSGGWRLNPNLYEEGKVCLSLLNTWTGRGNEVWDSKGSSILQVLVSLQGLVLNSKPYFNEAGYDKQVGTAEGERNSFSYNENSFLLNCKTMMYLIRRPPKDFDGLVKDHFKSRGYYILKACDAYMKGYLIGTLTEDASINEKSVPNATSVGFKLMLAKIIPKLYASLREVGADCSDFKHFGTQLSQTNQLSQ